MLSTTGHYLFFANVLSFQGKLKVATLNVRGLNDYHKRKIIFNNLQSKKADIILLQETHITENLKSRIETEWGNKLYHDFGTNLSGGVAISINPKIKYEVISEFLDGTGRLAILLVKVDTTTICIANCYAPNGDNPEYFNKLINKLEEFSYADITICGGDFNLVIDPIKDRLNSTHNPPKSSTLFKKLFR